MKILVTGSKGFIGKNLIAELRNRGYKEILEFDRETDKSLLVTYVQQCQFVFHLSGVNRTNDEKEFMRGNYEFTLNLLELLKKHNNKAPVLFSSSIQAEKNNVYGISKKAGEDLVFRHCKEIGAKPLVYRLVNVFGKWCRPNYNSAVATFCNNIARELPIQVTEQNTVMNLAYIDDVVNEFINALEGRENRKDKFCYIEPVYVVKLYEIVLQIQSFKESRKNGRIPKLSDDFIKKLYSTYLSYLPVDEFSYKLNMNTDNRGSFTEFIKTLDNGQVSINILKPGVTKGNHWHNTKTEKFLAVSGKGIVKLRKVDSDNVIEFYVSGDKLEVVDIPIGYTHNIVNIGDSELVIIIWVNEFFDQKNPDTFFLEV